MFAIVHIWVWFKHPNSESSYTHLQGVDYKTVRAYAKHWKLHKMRSSSKSIVFDDDWQKAKNEWMILPIFEMTNVQLALQSDSSAKGLLSNRISCPNSSYRTFFSHTWSFYILMHNYCHLDGKKMVVGRQLDWIHATREFIGVWRVQLSWSHLTDVESSIRHWFATFATFYRK